MDFETPAVCPHLAGRVTTTFRPLAGPVFFCAPGAWLRMSYAGHEDASGFPSNDVQLVGSRGHAVPREKARDDRA
jgi:hypothetical protein